MSTGRFLLIILVSFACTFFLRALPFLAFSGEKTMPPWLDRLSRALPPAIMAVLVIYCLKSVPDEWYLGGLCQLLGAAATALVHKWKHNTFLSIIAGTAVYMLLIRVL